MSWTRFAAPRGVQRSLDDSTVGRTSPLDGVWNGTHYTTKQVRPIFVDEPDEIVVVTVYVYYF